MATQKKYRTILADPPWACHRDAKAFYDLMELDHIKAMPVADLLEDDAHCWLWLTNSTIRDGFGVLEAWGLKPRSIMTWCKNRMGRGNYLRSCTEHLMLGTRGKASILFKGQPNWLFAPVQDHSHKPEEQYAVIERCSPGPYLELFSRRPQPGWDAWGNEIESDIVIPGYPVPKYREGVA